MAPRRKTLQQFIREARKIHGNNYDYSYVIYKSNKTKIKIFCISCQAFFEQVPKDHLRREAGCFKCSVVNRTKPFEQFIIDAEKIHGKNYDYSKVIYKSSKIKIKIICNAKRHIFQQRPNDHLKGNGCPECAGSSISKSSQKWLDFLKVPNSLGKTREVKIYIPDRKKPFIVDGFDPQTNTVYEFNGDFWHGNLKIYDPEQKNPINKKKFKELFLETTKRSEIIRAAGYNLVSIWESEWKEQEKQISLNEVTNQV